MEPSSQQTACPWCGRAVIQPATGRPRVYCRDSHRQRAYEARRQGWRMGLRTGEAIVSSDALHALADRMTVLEAALEDIEQDLAGDQDYEAALLHLRAAAEGLRGQRLRAIALGGPG